MMELRIETDRIELYKVLKVEGWAESGAAAKNLIANGLVRVNGIVETRKRKKLLPGDTVEFAGKNLQIVHHQV